MMDELERASNEFIRRIEALDDQNYEEIRDSKTEDENCRSIQTIASHVVNSGYGYANYIRRAFSMASIPYTKVLLKRDQVPTRMKEMLDYTAETLEGKWELSDEEIVKVILKSSWGTAYDLEQLLEHAIVHVLRHRRQMERFLSV